MKKVLWSLKLKNKDQPTLFSTRHAMQKSLLVDDTVQETNKLIITPEWIDGKTKYTIDVFKTKIKR